MVKEHNNFIFPSLSLPFSPQVKQRNTALKADSFLSHNHFYTHKKNPNCRKRGKTTMGSSSYESISSRIFHEEQYTELEFSDATSVDHENRSAILKHEDSWSKNSSSSSSSIRRKKNQVFLEGYVETSDEDELVRAKSLTDEDLDELKGCFDLGFGFSYDEIPELCNTLPALELCYSMSQKFLDEQQKSPEVSSSPTAAEPMNDTASPPPPPIANWKISSPGDHPEDVKARLKYWAQAVACTVRLCN